MNRLARNGLLSAPFISALNATPVHAGLILTGVYDGPLAGGQPKGVALYADTDIRRPERLGPGAWARPATATARPTSSSGSPR